METNKTDLAKILAVTGQHGLYKYVAQGRNGAIVESLATGERTAFNLRTRISSLADISIYTEDGELKLQDVFLKLKEVLGDNAAPSSKSSADELKKLFASAIPDYDGTRFYVSHMKKVVDWYNEILEHASFDFVNHDEESEEGAESADNSEEAAQ